MINIEDIYLDLLTLWNYLVIDHKLIKSDCILVFGGHDPSVAIHASKLFFGGWGDFIIISGGVIHSPSYYGNEKEKIEAVALRDIILEEGVPEDKIILEDKATNTSENFWFVEGLLKKLALDLNTFTLVQKPYTERRTFATAKKRWPDKKVIVTSLPISFDEYINSNIPIHKIINMMMGEVKRIEQYPKKGYMIYQEIPCDVWNSYSRLKQYGFNERESLQFYIDK